MVGRQTLLPYHSLLTLMAVLSQICLAAKETFSASSSLAYFPDR